ncbi:MAG: LacI family DNA-binding transcriptional regulator [Eubacterium sp.]|nr:LacI family DNA-binding transcriptional regulator [Eubacterium sp.]
MTTIKDIADRLGVSSGTVSKGLNGADDISEALRNKILETAVEMGYTKKSIHRQDTRKLCIFIENMDYYLEDDFGYDIILGFRQAAFKESWDVEVIPVSHDFQIKRPYDPFMLGRSISGALLIGFSWSDPWMKELETTKVPTILFDNYIKDNPMCGSVGSDSDEGIGLAIDHLAGLGHRKIAFLNGPEGSMISESRLDAYKKSMDKHGFAFSNRFIAHCPYSAEEAAGFVSKFIDVGVTAIICGNDTIAFGVEKECARLGYSVPGDISVIGYDDIPGCEKSDPPLTSVKQDRIQLGKCCYYVLYALVNGVSLSRNLLRTSLTLRGSTARVNERFPE